MTTRDLQRVEVMGPVAQEGLKLVDAAAMLRLSYRQVKPICDVICRWAGGE